MKKLRKILGINTIIVLSIIFTGCKSHENNKTEDYTYESTSELTTDSEITSETIEDKTTELILPGRIVKYIDPIEYLLPSTYFTEDCNSLFGTWKIDSLYYDELPNAPNRKDSIENLIGKEIEFTPNFYKTYNKTYNNITYLFDTTFISVHRGNVTFEENTDFYEKHIENIDALYDIIKKEGLKIHYFFDDDWIDIWDLSIDRHNYLSFSIESNENDLPITGFLPKPESTVEFDKYDLAGMDFIPKSFVILNENFILTDSAPVSFLLKRVK